MLGIGASSDKRSNPLSIPKFDSNQGATRAHVTRSHYSPRRTCRGHASHGIRRIRSRQGGPGRSRRQDITPCRDPDKNGTHPAQVPCLGIPRIQVDSLLGPHDPPPPCCRSSTSSTSHLRPLKAVPMLWLGSPLPPRPGRYARAGIHRQDGTAHAIRRGSGPAAGGGPGARVPAAPPARAPAAAARATAVRARTTDARSLPAARKAHRETALERRAPLSTPCAAR